MSEKPVPTITMRVVNRETFELRCDIENCPSLDYMILMVEQARRSLQVQYEQAMAAQYKQEVNQAMVEWPKIVGRSRRRNGVLVD